MPYKALLTFDFGDLAHDGNNQRTRMQTALLALGWRYSETTAFIYEQQDAEVDAHALEAIWQGIAIVGRGVALVGRLTALSYVIQDVQPSTRDRLGPHDPASALQDVRTRVFPGDAQAGNL